MTRSRALFMPAVVAAVVSVAFASGAAHAARKKPKGPPKDPKPPVEEVTAPFDREAALAALTQIDLVKCRAADATRGEGHVTMTFLPGGSATGAVVDKGPLVGTKAAKCVARAFQKAKIPAFKGDAVQVGKTFRFD